MISVRPGDTRTGRGAGRLLLELRARTARFAPLVLYLVSMVLTSAFFLPHLSEIGRWDEASYIYRGGLLLPGSGQRRIAGSAAAGTSGGFRHAGGWRLWPGTTAWSRLSSCCR